MLYFLLGFWASAQMTPIQSLDTPCPRMQRATHWRRLGNVHNGREYNSNGVSYLLKVSVARGKRPTI